MTYIILVKKNMEPNEIKKALAFIKENATEVPKTQRTGTYAVIPEEIVNGLLEQINARDDNKISVPMEKFNKLFGWKPEYSQSANLKMRLNRDYPQAGFVWHVGQINKNNYVFELQTADTTETDES